MMQGPLLDLYRRALTQAAALLHAYLENAVRAREQNLIAVRRALEEITHAAVLVGEAKTLDDLFALQRRVAIAHIEFWTTLWQVALGYPAGFVQHAQPGGRQPHQEPAHGPGSSSHADAPETAEDHVRDATSRLMSALSDVGAAVARQERVNAEEDQHRTREYFNPESGARSP
jgi:hypothetical protein